METQSYYNKYALLNDDFENKSEERDISVSSAWKPIDYNTEADYDSIVID